MKALVLCGGEGTRLRPFTFSQPKHLLPVAAQPVVAHVLSALCEAGLRDVGLVVSPSQEGAFRAALGDGSEIGVKLTYIAQPKPQGLAHAVLCGRDFVDHEDFLVVLGDNLLEQGVKPVVEAFARTGQPTLALARVEDPRRFGVAVLEGERVVRVVEKPAQPPSPWAIVGVYAFTSAILQAALHIRPSWRGELELTDAIQRLVDQGETVWGVPVEGWWQDIGRPADLLRANQLLLNRLTPACAGAVDSSSKAVGPVFIAAGAEVVRSRLQGPVRVEAGARVEEAEVGPYVVVGPQALVRRSRMQNSILMEEVQVENVALLTDSVLGRKAAVRHVQHPCALLVGDMASVTGLAEEVR